MKYCKNMKKSVNKRKEKGEEGKVTKKRKTRGGKREKERKEGGKEVEDRVNELPFCGRRLHCAAAATVFFLIDRNATRAQRVGTVYALF